MYHYPHYKDLKNEQRLRESMSLRPVFKSSSATY